MENQNKKSIAECFSLLIDKRKGNHKLHSLYEILVITLCAIICGAESCYDFYAFGISKEKWLREKLKLRLINGIPSHDTFNRVLSLLDSKVFEQCFRTWIKYTINTLNKKRSNSIDDKTFLEYQVISIDGKALKSATTSSGNIPYVVSAWENEKKLIIGQIATEEKSNEITAIPQLLENLLIEGCIITIDAAGCQTKIVDKIGEKKADYMIALKANQPTMLKEFELYFNDAIQNKSSSISKFYDVTKHSGRVEERTCYQTNDISWFLDLKKWKGLKSVCRIDTQLTVKGSTSNETRYYISSLPVNAKKALKIIRSHWGIENCVHWILDVEFNEDKSRMRNLIVAQNINTIRKIAINLVYQQKGKKESFKRIRNRLMWNEEALKDTLINF